MYNITVYALHTKTAHIRQNVILGSMTLPTL